MSFNIVLVGTGGQGVISASNILGRAALNTNPEIRVRSAETHGMAQRGGTVIVHLRFGHDIESPLVKTHTADVILSFELVEAVRYLEYLKPDGILLANNDIILPPVLFRGQHMTANPDRCIGCGNCSINCLVNLYYRLPTSYSAIDTPASCILNGHCEILSGCTGCMACAGICSQNALELVKEISYPPFASIEHAIKSSSTRSHILPVSQVASDLGDIRMANIVMIGALLAFDNIPLTFDVVQDAIREILKPSVIYMNLKALEAGRALIKKYL